MTYTLEQQMVKKALELMADPSTHLRGALFWDQSHSNTHTREGVLQQKRHCVGGALIKAGVLLGLTPQDARDVMIHVNSVFAFKYGNTIFTVNDDEGCAVAMEKLRKML